MNLRENLGEVAEDGEVQKRKNFGGLPPHSQRFAAFCESSKESLRVQGGERPWACPSRLQGPPACSRASPLLTPVLPHRGHRLSPACVQASSPTPRQTAVPWQCACGSVHVGHSSAFRRMDPEVAGPVQAQNGLRPGEMQGPGYLDQAFELYG